MNFTPLSQVIMALAITNCLRQCLLSLVLCMSLPPPPRLLLPNLSGFLQVGLKRLPRTRRLSFDENVRLLSVPFPWSLAVHHQSLAFRARLCHAKNEAPEEEAA